MTTLSKNIKTHIISGCRYVSIHNGRYRIASRTIFTTCRQLLASTKTSVSSSNDELWTFLTGKDHIKTALDGTDTENHKSNSEHPEPSDTHVELRLTNTSTTEMPLRAL